MPPSCLHPATSHPCAGSPLHAHGSTIPSYTLSFALGVSEYQWCEIANFTSDSLVNHGLFTGRWCSCFSGASREQPVNGP
eukprot:8443513-Alexandrium_andersonii.AAC.1